MAKPFSELRAKMSPEAQQRASQRADSQLDALAEFPPEGDAVTAPAFLTIYNEQNRRVDVRVGDISYVEAGDGSLGNYGKIQLASGREVLLREQSYYDETLRVLGLTPAQAGQPAAKKGHEHPHQ